MTYITFVERDEWCWPGFSVEGVKICYSVVGFPDVIYHCVGSYGECGASYVVCS